MRESLQSGVTGTSELRVVSEHLVSARLPSMPAVLASPWMLMVMEWAAHQALEPHLDEGETSLGIGFNFQHLAPTPAQATVRAVAEVIDVDRRRVTLHIVAHDGDEIIGCGQHVRAVVSTSRFAAKARQKADRR